MNELWERILGCHVRTKIMPLMALCGFPLIILGLSVFGMAYHVPFWVSQNFDPGYFYYFNALNVALGQPALFVDHPGTPLIMLGAGLLRIIYF